MELRRHERQTTDQSVSLVRIENVRDAHVADLGDVIDGHKNVVRSNVSMNHHV